MSQLSNTGTANTRMGREAGNRISPEAINQMLGSIRVEKDSKAHKDLPPELRNPQIQRKILELLFGGKYPLAPGLKGATPLETIKKVSLFLKIASGKALEDLPTILEKSGVVGEMFNELITVVPNFKFRENGEHTNGTNGSTKAVDEVELPYPLSFENLTENEVKEWCQKINESPSAILITNLIDWLHSNIGNTRSEVLDKSKHLGINRSVLNIWMDEKSSLQIERRKEIEGYTNIAKSAQIDSYFSKVSPDMQSEILKEIKNEIEVGTPLEDILSVFEIPRSAYDIMVESHSGSIPFHVRHLIITEVEQYKAENEGSSISQILEKHQVPQQRFSKWFDHRETYERSYTLIQEKAERLKEQAERKAQREETAAEKTEAKTFLNSKTKSQLLKILSEITDAVKSGGSLEEILKEKEVPSSAYEKMCRKNARHISFVRRFEIILEVEGCENDEARSAVLYSHGISAVSVSKWQAHKDTYRAVWESQEHSVSLAIKAHKEAADFLRRYDNEQRTSLLSEVRGLLTRPESDLSSTLRELKIPQSAYEKLLWLRAVETTNENKLAILDAIAKEQSQSGSSLAAILEARQIHEPSYLSWLARKGEIVSILAEKQKREEKKRKIREEKEAAKPFIAGLDTEKAEKILKQIKSDLILRKMSLESALEKRCIPVYAYKLIIKYRIRSLSFEERGKLIERIEEAAKKAGLKTPDVNILNRFLISEELYKKHSSYRNLDRSSIQLFREVRKAMLNDGKSLKQALKDLGIPKGLYRHWVSRTGKHSSFGHKMSILDAIEFRQAIGRESLDTAIARCQISKGLYRRWTKERERRGGLEKLICTKLPEATESAFRKVQAQVEAAVTNHGLTKTCFSRMVLDRQKTRAVQHALIHAEAYFDKSSMVKPALTESQITDLLSRVKGFVREQSALITADSTLFERWYRRNARYEVKEAVIEQLRDEQDRREKRHAQAREEQSVQRKQNSPTSFLNGALSKISCNLKSQRLDGFPPVWEYLASISEIPIPYIQEERAISARKTFHETAWRNAVLDSLLGQAAALEIFRKLDRNQAAFNRCVLRRYNVQYEELIDVFKAQFRQVESQVYEQIRISRQISRLLLLGEETPKALGLTEVLQANRELIERTPLKEWLILQIEEKLHKHLEAMQSCSANVKGRKDLAKLVAISGETFLTLSERLREVEFHKHQMILARQELAINNLRLAFSVAKRYFKKANTMGYDLEDVIIAANTGLLRGVEKYDHTTGFKFSTFATWWIRQSITRDIKEYSNAIRLPDHVSEEVDSLRDFITNYEIANLGRSPEKEEIASHFLWEKSKLDILMTHLHSPRSIDERHNDSERDGTLASILEAANSDDVTAGLRQDLRDALKDALTVIDPREAAVVVMRYGLGLELARDDNGAITYCEQAETYGADYTLEEVANNFAITRERIRQIEAKAWRTLLSDHPKTEKLRIVGKKLSLSYLDDSDESNFKIDTKKNSLDKRFNYGHSEIGLPIRLRNALEHNSIYVVEDILKQGTQKILQIHNVGNKAVSSILLALESIGLDPQLAYSLSEIQGLSRVTVEKLESKNINTLWSLLHLSPAQLESHLGRKGKAIARVMNVVRQLDVKEVRVA